MDRLGSGNIVSVFWHFRLIEFFSKSHHFLFKCISFIWIILQSFPLVLPVLFDSFSFSDRVYGPLKVVGAISECCDELVANFFRHKLLDFFVVYVHFHEALAEL